MEYTVKNSDIEVRFDSKGAEIVSVLHGGKEYIWQADPDVWARHTPVLFPFVGQVRDGVFRYDGKEYKCGQHGFARDMEFEMAEQTEDSISFLLKCGEEIYERYPFMFEFWITYRLTGKKVEVEWKVINRDEKVMHFSVGGHPGFMCPLDGEGTWDDYRIYFEKNGEKLSSIEIRPITTGGNVGSATKTLELTDSCLTPSDELFAGDALILENSQTDRVALIGPDGAEYLSVSFDTPLAGIWTPVGKHAPFICIEPWYGRTDSDDFTGSLEEREYSHSLDPEASFVGGYSFEVLK